MKSVMNINYHTTSSVLLTQKLFVRRESWKFHHTILKGVAFCSAVTYLDKCALRLALGPGHRRGMIKHVESFVLR